jgi:subtilisin family serine protease
MSAFRPRLGLAAAAAAFLVVLPASAVAQEGAAVEGTELADTQGAVEYAADQLVVGFEEDATRTEVSQAVAEVDGTVTESLPAIDASVIDVPDGQASEAIAALQADPSVEYVEPEVLLQATDVAPNDSLWSQQWGPKRIGAPAAWEATRGAASVVVAVIDTGVDPLHADLAGAVLPGFDFINNDALALDDNGHGTAAAGVIAARTNNLVGAAGVCWNCSIMPVKVLSAEGWGSTSAIASGILWAVNHGADVINLSLGGTGTTTALADAVAHAASQGVIVIAAAGNNGNATRFYPAAYPEVISVGASDSSDQRYSWSNYGSWVQFAAPGCNIAADQGGGYVNFCGTSSAAPIVSGIAGLAHALEPELSKSTFVDALRAAAVSIGSAVQYGRVDAAGTLEALGLIPPLNEARPKIDGATRVGSILTARNGRWAGSPTDYAYRWQRCNSAGKSCTTIANATRSTYLLKSRDLRSRLRVKVKATNPNGSRTARSRPTSSVQPTAPTVQEVGTTAPSEEGSAPPPSGEPSPPPSEPPPPSGTGGTEPTPVEGVVSQVEGVAGSVEGTAPPVAATLSLG